MIHAYSLMGRHIVIDVPSGAVHELDEAAFRLLQKITPPMRREPPEGMTDEENEIWDELYALTEQGLLFSQDTRYKPYDGAVLKALCLHVSHDCNLRCGYCFAGTGDFGTGRKIMPAETAERAIDFLLSRCGSRNNLEIDFFGGEPLMAFDTVKNTVEYARKKAPDKNFRFTITTNGILLDEEKIRYINQEMNNVVLSLDGRREVNDSMRKTPAGQGSYDIIVPKYKALLSEREGDYYVRGTYTSQNLDFTSDVEQIASEGFGNISIEPAVLPVGHPSALTEKHLPALCGEYEKLAEKMLDRDDFSFFHFNVDLEQGPCVYKRIKGCGAGVEYAAVTPEGDIYPCHQFVGKPEYKLGSVFDNTFDKKISDRFVSLNIYTRDACRDCWARYFCGGGCSASNLTVNGSIDIPDAIGCALEKKRLECAILLKVARMEG